MYELGTIVKVKEPFAEAFPDSYEVVEMITHDDGQIVYILNDIGGFDPKFIEEVNDNNNS